MDEDVSKRATHKWHLPFKMDISLGNIIILVSMAVGAVAWYSHVDSHIANPDIHPTRVQRDAEFDRNYELKTAPTVVELKDMNRRLGVIEDILRDRDNKGR